MNSLCLLEEMIQFYQESQIDLNIVSKFPKLIIRFLKNFNKEIKLKVEQILTLLINKIITEQILDSFLNICLKKNFNNLGFVFVI